MECAIVAPLLTLLVLGAIDLGQYANVQQTVSDASREGARVAARYDTALVSQVEAAVRDYLQEAFPGKPDTTIAAMTQVSVTKANGGTISEGKLTTVGTGGEVNVTVSVSYDDLRWVHGFPGINGKQVVSKTVMRRE
ncbi:pilus assembly protein [Aeoliella sp. ICT_H6.2]|uniref:Pilus assembly protein n=1 Tax=Aeoliella straminimaris TaxID=2954799 RepID=A0A9X2JGX9_9BACT|nr:pilus assembly protein [Aeoliella straminimaris]